MATTPTRVDATAIIAAAAPSRVVGTKWTLAPAAAAAAPTNRDDGDAFLYCSVIQQQDPHPSSSSVAQDSSPSPPPLLEPPLSQHVNEGKCACGCIPNIPGLFAMAEQRKEYRRQQLLK